MELTDEEKEYYIEQAKTISIEALRCVLIFFAGAIIIVFVGLLFRFLRLIFGSKVKPSAKKVIVITSATTGIGLELAKRFYKKGFSVVATYHNSREPGYAELEDIIKEQGVREQAGQDGPKMFLIYMDVRSEQSIDAAANKIEGFIKKSQLELYSVVCNASVCLDCPFELVQRDSVNKTMQTNVVGTAMVAKRFILPITKSKGRIVVVSNTSHSLYEPIMPIYAATKGAVKSFSDCLNENLKPYGASCRCVVTGNLLSKRNMMGTATTLQESITKLSPEERDQYKGNIEETYLVVGEHLKMKVNQGEEDSTRPAEVFSIELPERKEDANFAQRVRNWLSALFRNSHEGPKNEPEDVEEKVSVSAFDYAVMSKNPPRRCYCGSVFFQYISGPFVHEYMPQAFMPVIYFFVGHPIRRKF